MTAISEIRLDSGAMLRAEIATRPGRDEPCLAFVVEHEGKRAFTSPEAARALMAMHEWTHTQ